MVITMIKKILVANRGEIACRIIRTCKEMGIQTVAIYSVCDKNTLHTKLANESICIGGNLSKDSYLNMNNIIQAACQTGCDAIHPGFGFLSENSAFAKLVEDCNLIFIGPDHELIEKMGNKDMAKKMMRKAKIPVIPGSIGNVNTLEEGLKIANEIGFPLIIKATNGGGGRGMRICYGIETFEDMFMQAKAEALTCFLSDDVYIEKFFSNTKHIEVQIIADKHGNVCHLYERDCSFQRRNQKIIEEAPCAILPTDVRQKIINDAIKAAKYVKYYSVGTIEFLVDENYNHYFMEMNTRIQVEHPITEEICNIDIIKHQIKIADNQKLQFTQDDIKINGYAIECRINAEDIKNDFKPSPGEIKFIHFPLGKGIRIESGIYQGSSISPFYDSMIAKIIVHEDSRLKAIKVMRRALEELIIDGINTNIEFLYLALYHKKFIEGRYQTKFVQEFVEELKDGNII